MMTSPLLASIEVSISPRSQGWTALFVFSAVALGALEAAPGYKNSTAEKWVLIVTIISMVFSFIAVNANFLETARTKFIGTKIEQGMAALLLVLWAAGLVYIMDPDLEMAVTNSLGRPMIFNSNLYFSSWISFALIMLINGILAQEQASSTRDLAAQTSPKTMKWFALAGCAMVMLASSITFHRSFNCKSSGNSEEACIRNKFAISLGFFGALFGIIMSYLTYKGLLKVLHELIVSVVTLILFTLGVIEITFGPGPGATIGNLYFSTWLAFIAGVTLLSQCVHEYVNAKTANVEAPILNSPDEEAPILNSSDVETPILNSPDEESPILNSPDVEAPILNCTDVEAPILKSPDVEAPIPSSANMEGPASGADVAVPSLNDTDVEAPIPKGVNEILPIPNHIEAPTLNGDDVEGTIPKCANVEVSTPTNKVTETSQKNAPNKDGMVPSAIVPVMETFPVSAPID